jgi:predicted translin family RNA/ssDNA-binding protein
LLYEQLSQLIPKGQYYRFSDHWNWTTQRIVSLIALVIYLEAGFLVTRDTCAEILGLKSHQADGFHLDLESYLMGILQMSNELSRFAINSVTLGDYSRVLSLQRFVGDINSGFRLLNLKNDGLRKRFDSLKYDVKKIEEIVYDLSIRGLLKPVAADVSNINMKED